MQDNALLQRTIFKYESTLTELDVIFRNDDRETVVYDLKKLTENQLKEIIQLQKELDHRGVSPMQKPKHEESSNLQDQNDELLNERHSLL